MALSALTSPWKQLCVAHLPTKQRRFPSLALKPSPASSPPHPYTNALLVSSACHHSASTAYIYALGSPGGLVRPKIAEPTSRASHSGSLGWDPKFCITNKFPGDADVAVPPGTVLGELLFDNLEQRPSVLLFTLEFHGKLKKYILMLRPYFRVIQLL